MFSNQQAFKKMVASRAVNEGGRASGFGRANSLSYMYADAARNANLRRKGVQQHELFRTAGRQLLSAQNRALNKRGLAPVPGLAPDPDTIARPTALEFGVQVAQTAIGLATGLGSAHGTLTGKNLIGGGVYR